ncbi:MAG TPA: hypothetical protein VL309_02995 [Vicinamibacterales bacterium]|jgi:hypothetical protein|nr:hypothetical protein [Vicinamibacterales bacterium]
MRPIRIVRGVFYLGATSILLVTVPYAVHSTAASVVKSATLYSPILASDANGALACAATNVSPVPHSITMTLFDSLGTVLGATPTTTVPAGQSATGGVVGANIGYCRITVDGPASDVRAEILLLNGNALTLAAAPAY